MEEFIDEEEAWKYLEERDFENTLGVIYEGTFRTSRVLTKKERQAIEYLINEWDYSYVMKGGVNES